jgi:hypothetical protein
MKRISYTQDKIFLIVTKEFFLIKTCYLKSVLEIDVFHLMLHLPKQIKFLEFYMQLNFFCKYISRRDYFIFAHIHICSINCKKSLTSFTIYF